MKVSDTKPAATAFTHTDSFFKRGGIHNFFANETAKPSFFNKSNPTIQPKLTIGQPNDKYEQEADAVADTVVQRLNSPEKVQTKPVATPITPLLQTKCAACEKEEELQKKDEEGDDLLEHKKLQRKPIFESNAEPPDDEKNIQRKCAECEKEEKVQRKAQITTSAASPALESSLASARGAGSPLPDGTLHQMESSFGADFGSVRIHTGSHAVQMSKELNAQAFTHGSDIYFNSGKYDVSSKGGQHLLAHELTHVVQQGKSGLRSTINASPQDEGAQTSGDKDNVDPGTITTETQKDINEDDLGGIKVPDESKDEEDASSESTPDTDSGEGGESADAEVSPQDKDLKEESGGEQTGSTATIPENTPVAAQSGGGCPTIAPKFPEPPANATLEEENDSFFQELMGFLSGGVATVAITRVFGGGAYLMWRRLPMWLKVRAINFAIDRIISGAYWGRILARYVGVGTALISAVLLGFFRRLRQMPDDQKVRLFEKFGKIVMGGDVNFTFGLLKGLLIGFFVDGILSIVQMVIDVICIVPKIIDFFRSIKDFIGKVPYEVQLIIANIQEFFSSIGDTVKNAVSELMDLIKNPSKLIELVNTIYEAAAAQAEKFGTTMADTMIRYAALPPEQLGTVAGRIGGRLLYEGLLMYFSGGGEAAVDVVKTALREVASVLAKIGKEIFNIIKRLGAVFTFVKNLISKIIKFLTPLLKVVARVARRVIDKIKALFNLFRRMCKPGSVVCKVLKPNCRANRVVRLGGNPLHNAYVTRTTHQTMDYRVRAPFFGVRLPCNYDARLGVTRVLVEGKTGYRYLPFLQQTNPSLYRFIMFRLNEQRFRCSAIAARCGYVYVWYMQDAGAARFLNSHWNGIPPVLHMP